MNNEESNTLRPLNFEEFIGQKEIINNLKIYIQAAKLRDTSLDHTLLVGHAGLGKTSLAYLISYELNQNIIVLNANSIERPKDLIITLSKLNEGDILFIDEIHALSKNCEEILYSAMEDFYINLNVKNDLKKEVIRFDLPPFTLIGATTKVEDLSKPLLDRFSINFTFRKYSVEEITQILFNASKKLNTTYKMRALKLIASVSRFTPRVALNYLKRINDYSLIDNLKYVDHIYVCDILNKLGIKNKGLKDLDIRYLKMLHFDYDDKPVGINTISSFLNENNKVIEEMVENYLIELSFIRKTSKGRVITNKGITFLNSLHKKKL